jgi:hypothetical protein
MQTRLPGVAVVAIIASLLTGRSAVAAEPTIERLLVLDLASTGIAPEVARNLSEILASAIRDSIPRTTVLGQSEINSLLALEKQRDLLGCTEDVSCLAEMGGALGADHLVVGSAGRVGNAYVVSLKLMNTREAKTIRHVSKEISGNAELLIEAVRQWGANLVDPGRVAGFAYLTVLGEGEVLVDGVSRGKAPLDRLKVEAGSHAVVWQQENGDRHQTQVRTPAYADTETAMDVRDESDRARSQDLQAGGFSRSQRWWVSAHGGILLKVSAPCGGATTAGGTTCFDWSGHQAFGGRLSYLTKWGLSPFVGGEIRSVEFHGLTDSSGAGNASAPFYHYAGQLGVGYSTSGRLRIVPSLALEIIRARLVARDTSRESAQGLDDALDLGASDAAVHFGVQAAIDFYYALFPGLEIGARVATQAAPQTNQFVSATTNLVAQAGF